MNLFGYKYKNLSNWENQLISKLSKKDLWQGQNLRLFILTKEWSWKMTQLCKMKIKKWRIISLRLVHSTIKSLRRAQLGSYHRWNANNKPLSLNSSFLIPMPRLQRKLWENILSTRKMLPNLRHWNLTKRFMNMLQLLLHAKRRHRLPRHLHLFSKQMKESSHMLENQLKKLIRSQLLISRPKKCRSINSLKLSIKTLLNKKRLSLRNSI